MGYAKHPCARSLHSQGFAVGHIERYPCSRIHTHGSPFSSTQRGLDGTLNHDKSCPVKNLNIEIYILYHEFTTHP